MPREIHYTFTGVFAPQIIKAIQSQLTTPMKEARLVRSQFLDLHYMWRDWSDGGKWKPSFANSGSIFSPLFNLTQFLTNIKKNLSPASKKPDAVKTTFNGLIVLDIEEIAPNAHEVAADRPDQFKQILIDLGRPATEQTAVPETTLQVITKYLDAFFDLTLQRVKELRPKAKVGYYGFPNHRDGYFENASISKNVGFTAPCVYQWFGFPPEQHKVKNVIDRVQRAKREAPDKPCYPFVCPVLDGDPDKQTSLTTAEFENQVFGAFEAGADGVILWGDVSTTKDLTKWLNLVPVVASVLNRA